MSDVTKHSPEPWRVYPSADPLYVLDATGRTLCDSAKDRSAYFHSPADARRIVAAVNACAGIPTEALEAGALRELIDACFALWEWDDRPLPRIPMKVGDGIWMALRRLGRLP